MKKFRVITEKFEERTRRDEVWTSDDILAAYNDKAVTGISADEIEYNTMEEARAEYERRCDNAYTSLESGYNTVIITADIIKLDELEYEGDDLVEICAISEFAKPLK